jgi:hypothetical protein
MRREHAERVALPCPALLVVGRNHGGSAAGCLRWWSDVEG